jgi:hypothetical protein
MLSTMSGCLCRRHASRRCKFVVGGELDLSAAPIEQVVMFFNTSLGSLPDETRVSNIENAVDCSTLYETNERLQVGIRKPIPYLSMSNETIG